LLLFHHESPFFATRLLLLTVKRAKVELRHLLTLYTTLQPLHVHVVQDTSAPSFLQPCREDLTGKLRPLVGIENRRPPSVEGLVQHLNTKLNVHRDRNHLGQYKTAEPIDHGHQVDIPSLQSATCDIRAPHLVDPVYRQPTQEIGVDLVALRGLTEPGVRLDGRQTYGSQQPTDAFMIHGIAPAMQLGRHPANLIQWGDDIPVIKQPH
jgi:hypothetical protein